MATRPRGTKRARRMANTVGAPPHPAHHHPSAARSGATAAGGDASIATAAIASSKLASSTTYAAKRSRRLAAAAEAVPGVASPSAAAAASSRQQHTTGSGGVLRRMRRRRSGAITSNVGVLGRSGGSVVAHKSLYGSLRRAQASDQRMQVKQSHLAGVHFVQHADIEPVLLGHFRNLVRHEKDYLVPRENYGRHPELRLYMRRTLLDWIMEVCQEYTMKRETFYLAVNFIDRFIAKSKACIACGQLQLVGLAALFTASKIEEIYPPPVKEFATASAGAYSVADIKNMEATMIKALGWKLSPDTVVSWTLALVQQVSLTQPHEGHATPCAPLPFHLGDGSVSDYMSNMKAANDTSATLCFSGFHRDFLLDCLTTLDVCVLMPNFMTFRPRVLAAAALQACCPVGMEQPVMDVVREFAVCEPPPHDRAPTAPRTRLQDGVLEELHEAEPWVRIVALHTPFAIPHPDIRRLRAKFPHMDLHHFQTYSNTLRRQAEYAEAVAISTAKQQQQQQQQQQQPQPHPHHHHHHQRQQQHPAHAATPTSAPSSVSPLHTPPQSGGSISTLSRDESSRSSSVSHASSTSSTTFTFGDRPLKALGESRVVGGHASHRPGSAAPSSPAPDVSPSRRSPSHRGDVPSTAEPVLEAAPEDLCAALD